MQVDLSSVDLVLALPRVSWDRRKELPDSPGLYFAIVNQDQIAYVGASKTSMRRRWKRHNMRRPLERLGVIEVAYIGCDDLDALVIAEREAIRTMRPMLNFNHVEGCLEHWHRTWDTLYPTPSAG